VGVVPVAAQRVEFADAGAEGIALGGHPGPGTPVHRRSPDPQETSAVLISLSQSCRSVPHTDTCWRPHYAPGRHRAHGRAAGAPVFCSAGAGGRPVVSRIARSPKVSLSKPLEQTSEGG
jgi:hypothetical protein